MPVDVDRTCHVRAVKVKNPIQPTRRPTRRQRTRYVGGVSVVRRRLCLGLIYVNQW